MTDTQTIPANDLNLTAAL